MPHPFFEGSEYPWWLKEARALHEALYKVIPQSGTIDQLYRSAGPNLDPLSLQGGPRAIWTEALDALARAQRLKELCDLVLEKEGYKGAHDAAHAVSNVADPLEEMILSDDRVFIDRQQLRDKLQRIVNSPTYRVLLVRGGEKCGKSWTYFMIADLARSMDERCIYLFKDLVFNIDDVLDRLFTPLDGEPPARLETEDAWFRKICVRLQALGEKHGKPSWIVVDDLGADEKGPRLDPLIRQFFEQFVVQLGNFEFARWFRLVLIDYPVIPGGGRGVPTNWREVWDEDRPEAAHVDVPAVTRFVEQWARKKKKKIAAAQATKLAEDVIAAADAPKDDSMSRLRSIHDAIAAALPTL